MKSTVARMKGLLVPTPANLRIKSLRFASVLAVLPLASALAMNGLAAEVPTLPPGGTASVAGTSIHCTVTSTSISCTNGSGLTATLNKSGTVHVSRGSRTLFGKVAPMHLGVNGGFNVANAPLYCHVYLNDSIKTLNCYAFSNGGQPLPHTHGYAMTDTAVDVYQFDGSGIQHDIKTLS